MKVISRSATISGDEVYRYELTRSWDFGGRGVVWVMLNPSTADADVDDPTIRRCMRFSQREGFNRLKVVNLYALRAANPTALRSHPDPVGPENLHYLKLALTAQWEWPLMIVAWGARGADLARGLSSLAAVLRRPLFCLGTTRDGQPRHPLYVSGDTRIVPWRPEE